MSIKNPNYERIWSYIKNVEPLQGKLLKWLNKNLFKGFLNNVKIWNKIQLILGKRQYHQIEAIEKHSTFVCDNERASYFIRHII